jgi:hypothetical protein
MPSIEVIDNVDFTSIEAKSLEHFESAVAGKGLSPNRRGFFNLSGHIRETLEFVRPESAGPAPRARRTGVSSGVLGQLGYGSLRHASSVDWFVA